MFRHDALALALRHAGDQTDIECYCSAQKYGFRPFPAKIPRRVFERLRKACDDAGQALLDECFRLDTNVSCYFECGWALSCDLDSEKRRKKK